MEKPVVLLADDNDATCILITALLRTDFFVDIAHNGAEAIEKLKSGQYAAILLDLRMPVSDGYHVLDFLNAERRELLPRLIVVTASLAPRELERVRAYEICGVVAKPFDVETLRSAVRQCAGGALKPGTLLTGGMFLLLDFLRPM